MILVYRNGLVCNEPVKWGSYASWGKCGCENKCYSGILFEWTLNDDDVFWTLCNHDSSSFVSRDHKFLYEKINRNKAIYRYKCIYLKTSIALPFHSYDCSPISKIFALTKKYSHVFLYRYHLCTQETIQQTYLPKRLLTLKVKRHQLREPWPRQVAVKFVTVEQKRNCWHISPYVSYKDLGNKSFSFPFFFITSVFSRNKKKPRKINMSPNNNSHI